MVKSGTLRSRTCEWNLAALATTQRPKHVTTGDPYDV